ncbi:MAG: RimK/LysX family protein [Ekhidna sp.]
MVKRPKMIIGRLDVVDLPELGVKNIHAKIDTGAYRSSIHCKKVHLEGDTLMFTLHTDDGYKEYATKNWTQKLVKSSNGRTQKRYVINTSIRLFGRTYKASISLTDRSEMKNPLLIGRRVLNGRFIVDVSQKNLSYKLKQESE